MPSWIKVLSAASLGSEKSEEKWADSLGGLPLFAPKGLMGRPQLPPTIKTLYRADGTIRGYFVSATVAKKQRKRTVKTLALAKDLAGKWQGNRDESLQHLQTSLTPAQLRQAEAAEPFWASLGLTATKAAEWMVKHYKKPGVDLWVDVIEQYRQSRRDSHDLKPEEPDTPHMGNLVAAVKSFAAHVKRKEVGTITVEEVEAWLNTRGGRKQLLGDFRTFCRWCLNRGKMPEDPTRTLCVRKKRKKKLPVVRRPERVAEDLAILEVEAPDWIPYYVCCLFAFMRPGTREGEAQRLDEDIREGVQVVGGDGLLISLGKNGAPRVVPWKCTGPLRGWLLAYPPEKSLFPLRYDTGAKVERYWSRWRKRFGLVKDELRHTGMTAAYYFGIERNELDMAADNDPSMRKRHYLGRWSPEDTARLWAIRPKYSTTNRPPVATSAAPSQLSA